MERFGRVSVQLTATCLAASLTLIGPGIAGLGASPVLALLLVAIAAVLFVARDPPVAVGGRLSPVLAMALRAVWLGPLLGAALVLSGSASPGELQAYGGMVGLLGMLNYFLRPVYGLVFAAARYLRRSVDGTRGT